MSQMTFCDHIAAAMEAEEERQEQRFLARASRGLQVTGELQLTKARISQNQISPSGVASELLKRVFEAAEKLGTS